jgi:hypothetical protein
MTVLAIDPGFARSGKGCALALSDASKHLTWTGWARPILETHFAPIDLTQVPFSSGPDIVVWEVPQLDGRSEDKVATLIELMHQGSLVAMQVACEFDATLAELTPTQWKGSEPKPQAHARMWRALTAAERKLLGGDATWREIDEACERGALERWKRPGASYYRRGWTQHNILDACQLNLTYTRRLI